MAVEVNLAQYNSTEFACNRRASLTGFACNRQARLIKWIKPDSRSLKINVDGACIRNTSSAGIGALIGDSSGQYLGGLSAYVGERTSLEAELLAMWLGLSLARSLGFMMRRIILESDCKDAIRLVLYADLDIEEGLTREILSKIRELLCMNDWYVEITHCYREGNMCADWLAKEGLGFCDIKPVIFENPPRGLRGLLLRDTNGFKYTRD